MKVFNGPFELKSKGEYITNLSYDLIESTNKINCEIFN